MDPKQIGQNQLLSEIVRDQFEYLLAMLVRPVVQQQLLVILLVLTVSGLLAMGLRRWRRAADARAVSSEEEGARRRWRLADAGYYLVPPLLALVFLNLANRLYALRGLPDGILSDFAVLIWLWLGYRAVKMLLNIFFGEASRPYRKWIVTPIFVTLVLVQLLRLIPGSVTLTNATVNLGSFAISFRSLLSAAIVLYFFIIAGWVVREFMMHWLPSRMSAEQGVIDSVSTLTRYALMAVGILASLSLLGLDFTSLAIVAGGLSVGIGIGLQDFVSNFVSGLVLLFEQTLRPGDVVEVDNRISQVQKISLRATTVRTLTNQELIIPNTTFTSQQVTNLTKTDRVVRVLVPLGVSYKNDPDLVRQVATETATQHPQVLAEPPPFLAFLGYGESSLDFNLSVSVDEPQLSGLIRSDLYYMLWRAFEAHGIEVPFPQRDLNLGQGWDHFVQARMAG